MKTGSKTTYDCVVESLESTRQRAESSQPKNHEDHIASKWFTSTTNCSSVHKFIPMPQTMKIPDAKAAVDKEWKKLETIPTWDLEKVKSKKEVILEAQREQKEMSTLPHWRTFATSKMRGWNQNYRSLNTKAPVVLRGGHSERRLWSLRSFYWTGLVCVPDDCSNSNGRYRKITRFWWTSSWCSICLCTQFKLEDAPRLLTIPKSECPDVWILLPRHKWPISCGKIISWTKFVRSTISRIAMGMTIRRSFFRTWMGENSDLGMHVRSSETSDISVSICGWDDIKMTGKKQNVAPMWKKLMENVDIDEPTSFLDHVYLGCTQRECKPRRSGWQQPHAQTVAWSYDMEGHAQKCVERYCE